MINNNPYNIPERPLKQKKIVIETSPLFPHQINRTQDEEYRHRFPHQKKQTAPYFIQSTVTQVSRIPVSPQQPFKPQPLQMSTVTQWDGFQSNHTTFHLGELNEKIAAITQKLQTHEKKLTFLIETQKSEHLSNRKQDPISTNLSQSASFSMQILSLNGSKQMERYHSTEETWDKIRQEFISYRSQSERFGENLRAQLHQQKDSITRELINNFKDSLRQKFDQEEIKIADYLAAFTQSEKAQLDRVIQQLKIEMKDYLQTQLLGISKKDHLSQSKSGNEIKILKGKVQHFTEMFEEFQSRYRSFKEEVRDNVLATHDHKRWLYEIQQQIIKFHHSLQKLEEDRMRDVGTLKVSKEYCFKEAMHLRYEEYLSVVGSTQPSIQTYQRTYFIDEQGFLLDSNRFYLVDSGSNRIRLSQGQIAQLKSLNLLK